MKTSLADAFASGGLADKTSWNKKGNLKKFFGAPSLWVGRRYEPILAYVSQIERK